MLQILLKAAKGHSCSSMICMYMFFINFRGYGGYTMQEMVQRQIQPALKAITRLPKATISHVIANTHTQRDRDR